ncbi:MFS transporter [Paraburkholderia mimosarum]|uniref:hypothetical protein n=1 Tax=Paraburkholderia mimosarum TaxID=312026 RepID=UPI0003FF5271
MSEHKGDFARDVRLLRISAIAAVGGALSTVAADFLLHLIRLFTVGRHVDRRHRVTAAFPLSVAILLNAGTSPVGLNLFAAIYGGANGMMTSLRGTIVQDVMGIEGYGAISELLSMPSNIAKGIAPISAAMIWTIDRDYGAVEWTVLLVSLVSTVAFAAVGMSSRNRGVMPVSTR